MDVSSLLLVGIEVSVAFAGFAGIIATFQFRDVENVNRGEIVGLTMIVNFSLTAAFACTLPLILSIFGIDDATIWTICSALSAIAVFVSMYSVDKNIRGVVRTKSIRIFFGSLQGIAALIVLSLVLNAANFIFHRESGPVITAITFGLSLVGYMFARLLLRPLWRWVHEKELANPQATSMR